MGSDASGPEKLAFDSDAFVPSERLNRYREANGPGVEAKEAGPAFTARFVRWRLDRIVLHDRYLNDVAHERSSERASSDGIDHHVVHVVRSGFYAIDGGEGFRPVLPGEAVFVDMSKPMRSRASDATIISVSLARYLLGGIGNADDLHCRLIARLDLALFVDFAVSVAQRAPQLRVETIGSVTSALVSLLSAVIEPGKVRAGANEFTEADAVRLDRVQRIIEQSLGDPLFGPDMVVAKSGLSRATLYRMFKPRGGLRAYIQRRRLDRVRVALSSVSDRRPLGVIAGNAGFLSEGHCSRLFLSAFGIRPGEYRAQLADVQAGGGPEPRLSYWLAALR